MQPALPCACQYSGQALMQCKAMCWVALSSQGKDRLAIELDTWRIMVYHYPTGSS
jgi:hypothetical protein